MRRQLMKICLIRSELINYFPGNHKTANSKILKTEKRIHDGEKTSLFVKGKQMIHY